MHAPALRRTRTAVTAGAALALSLVVVPLASSPAAAAGPACDNPLTALLSDCEAPESNITVKPTRLSESTTSSFEVTTVEADDDDPDVVFECRLERGWDAPVVVRDWTDCSVLDETAAQGQEPRSLGRATYSGLVPGKYTFLVRASDVPLALPEGVDYPNVEATPETYQWTILESAQGGSDDPGAPETTITTKVKRWHTSPFVSIDFAANEEAQGYVCKVRGRETDCADGTILITGMGAGEWDFSVAAVDLAGNVDRSPATLAWTVPRNNTNIPGYSDHWRMRKGSGYFADTYSVTKRRGATIKFGTKGVRELVLVATKGPDHGKLQVSFQGKVLKTVDLRAATVKHRRVIKLDSWRKAQSGRFVFKVVTSGRPVIIEGLGLSLRRTS